MGEHLSLFVTDRKQKKKVFKNFILRILLDNENIKRLVLIFFTLM